MGFEKLFFTILPGHILCMETPFGTSILELIKPSCQAKTGTQMVFFHLNNRMNFPLYLKKVHTYIHIFMKDTPVLALKII